jgi:hypothetical protein
MVADFSFWMVVTAAAAVCGCALSWRRRTPLDRSMRQQLRIAGSSFSSAWCCALHCWLSLLSAGSVRELVHIPEQCQHTFSNRGCRLEIFFCQERMCVVIPWIVFWILVHNNEPTFYPPWQCAQETLHPQHGNMSRKLFNSAHTSTCVHRSTVSAPTWNTAIFESLMDDAMSRSNANIQRNGNSVHIYPPVLTSKCIHVSNCGITDGFARATWAMFFNERCSHFLKYFYPLVHVYFTLTASTILLNHSSMTLPQFHSFWPQISYYRTLLLSGAIVWHGGHDSRSVVQIVLILPSVACCLNLPYRCLYTL